MKGSFCLGQGQSHGTQTLPGSAPTPPCTSSCAVSSLPKVFEALLQYQRRHAHRPALSSHVLAPRLFGLQRLPTALPLRKTLTPPRSHPLVTARLCPAAAPSPAGLPSSERRGVMAAAAASGRSTRARQSSSSGCTRGFLGQKFSAEQRGRQAERAARQAGLLHRVPASKQVPLPLCPVSSSLGEAAVLAPPGSRKASCFHPSH